MLRRNGALGRGPHRVLCHEHRRSTRRCATVLDMKEALGFGDQVADPKSPRAAVVKSQGRERRGNVGAVIAADLGQLVRREEPFVQWKAAAFARWHEPDE